MGIEKGKAIDFLGVRNELKTISKIVEIKGPKKRWGELKKMFNKVLGTDKSVLFRDSLEEEMTKILPEVLKIVIRTKDPRKRWGKLKRMAEDFIPDKDEEMIEVEMTKILPEIFEVIRKDKNLKSRWNELEEMRDDIYNNINNIIRAESLNTLYEIAKKTRDPIKRWGKITKIMGPFYGGRRGDVSFTDDQWVFDEVRMDIKREFSKKIANMTLEHCDKFLEKAIKKEIPVPPFIDKMELSLRLRKLAK